MEGGFQSSQANEMLVGLHVGPVYRLSVAGLINYPQVEIFPTVEVIDRLYPPTHLALRYPIPIDLTEDELELAARGAFVTRVIYVEDPHQALPVTQRRDSDQPWMEAPRGEDPFVTADHFGRPVAIVRIGGRVPRSLEGDICGAEFIPPAMMYDPTSVSPENCVDGTPALQALQSPAEQTYENGATR
jgi:hypothetical protein